MITCYNRKDFEESKIELESFQKEKIDKAFIFSEKISEFHECITEIKLKMRGNEYWYIEDITHYLKHDTLKITIHYYDYAKKYCICCYEIDRTENVSTSQITQQKNKVGEPKNMRTLSKLKIREWIKFYENVSILVSEVKKNNDTIRENLIKKFSIFPIKWVIKDTKGYISLNGIRYTFNIEPNHFSESLEIENLRGKDKFGIFIRLSNNQLNTF